jgi:hypothetical protein
MLFCLWQHERECFLKPARQRTTRSSVAGQVCNGLRNDDAPGTNFAPGTNLVWQRQLTRVKFAPRRFGAALGWWGVTCCSTHARAFGPPTTEIVPAPLGATTTTTTALLVVGFNVGPLFFSFVPSLNDDVFEPWHWKTTNHSSGCCWFFPNKFVVFVVTRV